jgi:pilus assembly protein CpaC
MSGLHPTAHWFCLAVWLGFCVTAQAQTKAEQTEIAQASTAPGEAARAAAGMARGIANGILSPSAALSAVPSAGALPGAAQLQANPLPAVTRPPRVQSLSLEAGTGRIVSLTAQAASVFAADPKVAEVRPASPTSLFVLGVAPGRTTIAAIGDTGAAIAEYDVTVLPSTYAAARAQTAIAQQLPGQNVKVTTRPSGLVVSGTLPMASEADQAMQTARDYAGAGQTVESRLAVLGGQQVNLRVRIAEVSRNVIRQLGINWNNLASLGKYAAIGVVTSNPLLASLQPPSAATLGYNFPTPGRTLDINALIDAMSQDQLVHVLAEPNLTAMSGETASFLVGGEFPIPVAAQNFQVTIEFKQYGVSLAFVPTVLSGGRINMKVRPEVSALSTLGAVQLGIGNSTIQIPALTVRRAETTVELASGQSFAIAGLLQDNNTLTGNALPGIGDVPVLGALFRSDAFQRNETELVIVITPYLVTGAPDPAQLKLPTDDWKPPSDLERILLLRQSARASGPPAAVPHIPGDAGFLVR